MDLKRTNPLLRLAMAGLVGLAIADLVTIEIESALFPSEPPPALSQPLVAQSSSQRLAASSYSSVTRRNFVSPLADIPRELEEEAESNLFDADQEPEPTNLPLTLIGTLVHGNPKKSIATIQNKSGNSIRPFLVGDEIDGMARIQLIERKRVVFINLSNSRREFIEIPKDFKINFGRVSSRPFPGLPNQEAQSPYAVGANQFELSRREVKKYTSNLGDLLQQALAVPSKDPRTGEVNGYLLKYIRPDSIFTKLGVKTNDIIDKVNGNPVRSANDANQLYQTLQTEDRIEVEVKRGGQNVKLEFRVTN